MDKIFTFLIVLVAFGLIFGGIFLVNSITSVDVSEDFAETLKPVILYDGECEPPTPGYPDPCDPY